MSVRSLVIMLLLAASGACGQLHSPRGTVPIPDAARTETFGGWARIDLIDGTATTVAGELIAVSAGTVWVLTDSGGVAIPVSMVRKAEVTGFDSEPGNVIAAAAVGFVSTVSNGYFLIFTAPAWLVTGAAASSSQARHSRRSGIGRDLSPLATFARFPQGLPPGLDLGTLRPKP